MDKYISADKLRAMMYHEAFDEDSAMQRWDSSCWIRLYKMFERVIERIEPAHVHEVRHGRWEHLGGDEWCCTACAHIITTEGSWERPWQKYCEECGAKMDEVEE